MVERLNGIEEVRGSNPLGSTSSSERLVRGDHRDDATNATITPGRVADALSRRALRVVAVLSSAGGRLAKEGGRESGSSQRPSVRLLKSACQ